MNGGNPDPATKETGIAAFLRIAVAPDIFAASVKVALVVGSLLNLVNQGARLWQGEAVNWFTFCLNFVVPYCVASYSAALNELRRRRRG